MRTVKFNNKDYPLLGTGQTSIIMMDELHCDIFISATEFIDSIVNKDRMPSTSLTSKLMYALIKTANPDAFHTYEQFMSSTRKLVPFVEADNLKALLDEVTDMYSQDEEDKAEEADTSKKKKAESN